jgi:hypothetical protein
MKGANELTNNLISGVLRCNKWIRLSFIIHDLEKIKLILQVFRQTIIMNDYI